MRSASPTSSCSARPWSTRSSPRRLVSRHTSRSWQPMHAFISRLVNSMIGSVERVGTPTVYGRPVSGKVNIIPAAIAAGIGELGKHGSIMSRELGANMRLSYVLTELPLVPAEQQLDFGVDDFCLNCRLCTNACPPQAISDDKQLVRGVERWYVDFDKCVPYFSERRSCGICLAVCPWARPEVSISELSKKMLTRREQRARHSATAC